MWLGVRAHRRGRHGVAVGSIVGDSGGDRRPVVPGVRAVVVRMDDGPRLGRERFAPPGRVRRAAAVPMAAGDRTDGGLVGRRRAVVTVVAFTALARYGVSLGVGPALVAVVALALQLLLVVVVAAARVTAGVFGSLARSRTGAAMVGITTAAMMVITQWGGWWSSPSTAQAFSTPASVVGSPGCCDGSRRAGASSPCRPPIATIGRLLSPPSPGSPS